MKRFIPILLFFAFLLSACGALEVTPEETIPTISAEDIRATADLMVYDMLTQTQAAMPTNTFIPPTNTPLPPPTATLTTVPTLEEVLASPTISVEVASATPLAVATNTVAPSGTSCMDQQLNSWTGASAQLDVANYVPDTTAYVFLCIITIGDEIGYMSVPEGSSISVPQGCYSATAWVSGAKDFNATTTFCINNNVHWKLVIENGGIFLRSACYPNC